MYMNTAMNACTMIIHDCILLYWHSLSMVAMFLIVVNNIELLLSLSNFVPHSRYTKYTSSNVSLCFNEVSIEHVH